MSKLNANDVVIIRAWFPTNDKKIISYPEAWFRITFTPSNEHAHIGHLALTIRHGEREEYVSIYPTETRFFTTSPARNNTLKQDIESQDNLPPDMQVVLFSLDTEKMLARLDELQQDIRYYIFGDKLLLFPDSQYIYNCSGYAQELLTEGGFYNHLLSLSDKLDSLITPKDVVELAAKAAEIESKCYPERAALLQAHIDSFTQTLLTKSQDPNDPCQAVKDFLEENPDFYLRVNQLSPNAISTLLPLVYDNIQNHLNARLLKLAEDYISESIDYISAFEKLLTNGANLSSRNKEGYNALHLMIKNNCTTCVDKILACIPQAVNNPVMNDKEKGSFGVTPLDLAIAVGNQRLIDLIKRRGGVSSAEFANTSFKCRLFQNPCALDESTAAPTQANKTDLGYRC